MLTWTLLEEIEAGDRVALLRRPLEMKEALTRHEVALATVAGGMVSEGWASQKRAGFDNLDRAYFDAVSSGYDEVVGGRRYEYAETMESGNVLHRLAVGNLTSFKLSPPASMM